jgi:AraC-like DNA-binding protein
VRRAEGDDPLEPPKPTTPPELARTGTTSTNAGILRPADGSGIGPVYRPPADPALADFVERYWSVAWSQSTGPPARREVLSHPAFHLTVTTQLPPGPGPSTGSGHRAGSEHVTGSGQVAAAVRGVVTRTFAVDLQGQGRVVGAKFRPGGFTALTGRAAYAFTDRAVPLADLVPAETAARLTATVAAAPDDPDVAVAALGEVLAGLVPSRPPAAYALVLAVVADMLADRTLSRVEDVAARHGLSMRGLQRLFRRFVGVGPKWVLQRYRLHDAVSAIDSNPGALADLAGLATSLGWSDQSHFTRDFTLAVGVSPHAYAARALVPP